MPEAVEKLPITPFNRLSKNAYERAHQALVFAGEEIARAAELTGDKRLDKIVARIEICKPDYEILFKNYGGWRK